MSERDDRGAGGRDPAEGVRIIGADEAQAALEAGEAAGRRPGDQLRFGDVPPAPSGPRPAHRFPLPDSVDPSEAVDLPRLAPRTQSPERSWAPPPPPAHEPEAGDQPDSYYQPETGHEPETDQDDYQTVTGYRPDPATDYPAADYPAAERPAAERPAAERPAAERPVTDYPATEYPAAEYPATEFPGGEHSAGRPPVAGSQTWSHQPPPPPDPAPIWSAGPGDRTAELGVAIPDNGINLTGSHTEMPHWADPPTGEVPRLRFDEDEAEAYGDGDDEAARAAGPAGARWRHEDDWDDVDSVSDLADDFDPHGALDQSRAEHSDLFSFDEDFERVTSRHSPEAETGSTPDGEAAALDEYQPATRSSPRGPMASGVIDETAEREVARTGSTTRVHSSTRRPGGRPPASGYGAAASRATAGSARGGDGGDGGDIGGRIGVGLGLVVLLIICYALGAKGLLALAVVVVAAAAAEAYNMTRQLGFRPATLLGLVGSVGCVLAAYWKGLEAIPIVAVLFFAATMLWFVLGIERARPVVNVAVTVMVFVWVAVLGSFSAVLLDRPHGKGAFLGAVVVAVAADIMAYAVGRWIGSRPIAASISPNKTLEGYIGGLVAALIAGVIIGKELTPWGGMRHGLVLGLLIGLVAPVGDLFESLLKRDLGLKDSGKILGGHGGLLDRFDAILLALPLSYFVLTLFKL